MERSIKIPKIAQHINEITIYKWLVKEGDIVLKGQIVAEVETDKATMDIYTEHSGRITHLLFEEGDDFPAGTHLGIGVVTEHPKPTPEERMREINTKYRKLRLIKNLQKKATQKREMRTLIQSGASTQEINNYIEREGIKMVRPI